MYIYIYIHIHFTDILLNYFDHPESFASKFYGINNFNKSNVNKSFTFKRLHLNINLLPKDFDHFHNLQNLLNHPFIIIIIRNFQNQIGNNSNKINLNDYIIGFS